MRTSAAVLGLVGILALGGGRSGEAAPALIVSPPPGTYTTTQAFDLALVIDPDGRSIDPGTSEVTLDDVPVTSAMVNCARFGATADGRLTLRCPGLSGVVLGPGIHLFRVTVGFTDGSQVQGGALWDILDAAGP